MFDDPSVKILLFIGNKEVRFADLTKLISSRGALSSNLKCLEQDGLVSRRVVPSKPIQAYYSLTEKGKKAAKSFSDLKVLLQ
ncbi:MAG: helix-turn-helix transcriptional regulator [Candidatus Bathyarchaeota archaeon]|nr:helix-turn-helix transcriptional regulator [Candidatus Bathyarchaeota archaeon]